MSSDNYIYIKYHILDKPRKNYLLKVNNILCRVKSCRKCKVKGEVFYKFFLEEAL